MIQNLQEIRSDGKVIEESMTLDVMDALGWDVCRVTCVRWLNGTQAVELPNANGLLVGMTQSREFLAGMVFKDAAATQCELCIFNSDGTLRHIIPNSQYVGGLMNSVEPGKFLWFERSAELGTDEIRVVFEVTRNHELFSLDIDAKSGRTLRNKVSR